MAGYWNHRVPPMWDIDTNCAWGGYSQVENEIRLRLHSTSNIAKEPHTDPDGWRLRVARTELHQRRETPGTPYLCPRYAVPPYVKAQIFLAEQAAGATGLLDATPATHYLRRRTPLRHRGCKMTYGA